MAISIVILPQDLKNYQQQHPDGVVENFSDKADMVRFTFAKGRVVDTYERNGYDDSDFFAIYQANDGSFKETMYASTRGSTYDNIASIDCSPEMRQQYTNQRARESEGRRELFRKMKDERVQEACDKANITREQYDSLRALYNEAYTTALVKLLSAKLRSTFRISLANQVRAWLESPADQRHKYPLSQKQIEFL